MRLYNFLLAAILTVLGNRKLTFPPSHPKHNPRFSNAYMTMQSVHAAVVPKASVRGIAAQPLPLKPHRSPDTAPPRFTAPAGNPQQQSPQIRPSAQGPIPRLTANDNLQVVPPELSLDRQTNVDYSLLKTSQRNPVFTIDLRNGVNRWRLHTNIKLNTQKTVFLVLNQTTATPGDGYSIQTLEQKSGKFWESIPFRLRTTQSKGHCVR